MNKYKVTIIETRKYIDEVEANSEKEAISKVEGTDTSGRYIDISCTFKAKKIGIGVKSHPLTIHPDGSITYPNGSESKGGVQ